MKKNSKVLLILLIIGIAGTAITSGFILGSGQLMPRQATREYEIGESLRDLELDTVNAKINIVPSESSYVTAYANAWLPQPVEMENVVNVSVEDGTLRVTETPFPSTFLGVFPQPYELIITLYIPPEICGNYQEENDR